MSQRIESLARRVEEDPGFLAFALAAYARSEKLDDAALAQFLGCDRQQLSRLRLCRYPRDEPRSFQGDLNRIAATFGIDSDILLEVVRRSAALFALRDVATDTGFLMAARDREDQEMTVDDDQEEAP